MWLGTFLNKTLNLKMLHIIVKLLFYSSTNSNIYSKEITQIK